MLREKGCLETQNILVALPFVPHLSRSQRLLPGKESREARVILEEVEISEGEALRNHVVRQQEWVCDGKARHGGDFRHEDGGAESEGARIPKVA